MKSDNTFPSPWDVSTIGFTQLDCKCGKRMTFSKCWTSKVCPGCKSIHVNPNPISPEKMAVVDTFLDHWMGLPFSAGRLRREPMLLAGRERGRDVGPGFRVQPRPWVPCSVGTGQDDGVPGSAPDSELHPATRDPPLGVVAPRSLSRMRSSELSGPEQARQVRFWLTVRAELQTSWSASP